MKILVIAPQYRQYGQFYELPLGLAYISAYLKSKGKDVNFVNLNERGISEAEIKEADVACTGGLSMHYHQVLVILTELKRVKPDIFTIVGGGLFSSMPEVMYRMLSPYIDIGVIGEGEELTNKIIDDLIEGCNIPIIMPAETIRDLDSLPFPDYAGMGVEKYLDRQLAGDEHYLYPFDKPRCVPVISSRSCPFNCAFCFHPTGKVYRQRSLDNFFSEIEYLIDKYHINMVGVLDELLSQFPERINLFCQRIKKYNLKWMTQLRVDGVDQDTINMLKDSGCFQISYGIEHINPTILDNYNKKITPIQIENVLEMTYEAGIGIQGNLILGGPRETMNTVQQAIIWRNKNRKYMLNITAVIPYPGTDMFNEGIRRGMINPSRYVEESCPFINYSNIPLSFPVAFNYGELISTELVSRDPHKGDIKKVKARCPHCKQEVEYTGLYWGSTGLSFTQGRAYRIACRKCNQRFDLERI